MCWLAKLVLRWTAEAGSEHLLASSHVSPERAGGVGAGRCSSTHYVPVPLFWVPDRFVSSSVKAPIVLSHILFHSLFPLEISLGPGTVCLPHLFRSQVCPFARLVPSKVLLKWITFWKRNNFRSCFHTFRFPKDPVRLFSAHWLIPFSVSKSNGSHVKSSHVL